MNSQQLDSKLVFTVGVFVNFASTAKDPYDASTAIKGALASIPQSNGNGKWDLVWGPSVSVGTGWNGQLVSDNAMYVAKQENTNNYVIGIAGSNVSSPLDWLVEDAWVVGTVPWGQVIGATLPSSDGNPMISPGANVGLNNLLSTTPWLLLPGGLSKLTDFLASESSKNGALNLYVCGHSLGGALAPVLALYLQNTSSTWDKSGSSTITGMPVAGPTPGNADFAKYLSGSAVAITGYYNTFDVVPHAWDPSTDSLGAIPKLYIDGIPESGTVDAVVVSAITLSVLGAPLTNPYTFTARTGLPGQLNKGLISGTDSFADFMAQVGFQHTLAYVPFLAVPGTETLVGTALAGPLQAGGNSISTATAAAIQKAGRALPANVQIVPSPVIRRVSRAPNRA